MNIGMLDRGVARHGHSLARGTILAVALLGFATFEAPTWIPGSASQAAQQAASSDAPKNPVKPTPAKDAPPKATAGTKKDAAPTPGITANKSPGGTATPPEDTKQPGAATAEAAPQEEEWHRMTATPAPAVPSNAPAQTAAIPSAAELRSQFNELSVRANTANSRLQSFQEQQSRQGLSLRADIREAQARMDLQMQESATALESGNFDAARQSMRYAQSAVETIEKFLGR